MLGKCYLHMCQYVHWLEAFLYVGREFADYVLWLFYTKSCRFLLYIHPRSLCISLRKSRF